jgi:hypothetical protein
MARQKVLQLVLQFFRCGCPSRLGKRMADNRALQRQFLVLAALQNPQVDGVHRSGDRKRSDQPLQRQPPGQTGPEGLITSGDDAPPHS